MALIERFPLGERGEYPVRFGGVGREYAQELAYQIPGVIAVSGGLRCVWDAAPVIARTLSVKCPTPPKLFVDEEHLPGLVRAKEIRKEFRKYQWQGGKFIGLRAFSVNADGMRLGKTRQAVLASILRGAEKTLIVPPGKTRRGWAREIKKILPDAKVLILYGRSADTCRWAGDRLFVYGREACIAEIHRADWVICNPDLLIPQTARDGAGRVYVREELPGWTPVLLGFTWDECILDEVHKFRGWKDSRTLEENKRQTLFKLCDPIRVVSALTGTPHSAKARDFWFVWQLISKTAGAKPFTYHARYAGARHIDHEISYRDGSSATIKRWDDSGISNPEELVARKKWFIIRRLQNDVMSELPQVTRQTIKIDPEKSLALPVRGDAKSRIGRAMEATMRLKLPIMVDDAADEFDEGRKIFVLTYRKSSCSAAAKSLEKLLKKFEKLRIFNSDGVTSDRRDKLAEQFREHDGPAAFVSTIDGSDVGLDLEGAESTYFLELHKMPTSNSQASYRPRKPGKRTAISERYYVVKDSIDEIRALDMLPAMALLDKLQSDGDSAEIQSELAKLDLERTEEEEIAALTAHLTGEEDVDED